MNCIPRALRTVVFAAMLVAAGGCVSDPANDAEKDVLRLQLASAHLALFAHEQDPDRIGKMRDEVKEMQVLLQRLPERRARKLTPLLRKADTAVTTLERTQRDVLVARQDAGEFNTRTPQLSAQAAEVVRGMADIEAPTSQIIIANRQIVLLDRMARRMTEIVEGGDAAVSAADALQRDLAVFQQVHNGLLRGADGYGITRVTSPAGQAALLKIDTLLVEHVALAGTVLSHRQAVEEANRASEDLVNIHFELLGAMARGH